ncbi:MAG: hypothetical protein U0798_08290 [Gemmataceae bacterium]
MTPSDLLLAAMLLTAPPGTPETIPPAERWPAIQAAVQDLAIQWEILDKAETKYLFADSKDFKVDLEILRNRYVDLASAPKAAEAYRFPDRRFAAEMIQFNRAYRSTLSARQIAESDRIDDLSEAIKETDRLYHVWDAARDARCDYYHITVRRQALKKLKSLLGDEEFARGELPPNVPTWRFAEGR